MTSRFRTVARVLLVALVPLAGGCAGATGGLVPSATMTTAIQGWESRLSLDWEAAGQDITGYVNSKYGAPIVNVRLLAQGLDADGNVVGQKIEWLNGTVPSLQRAYFRIANMPPAARYRVSVWSFDTLESVGDFL
jgi:hypothetical protein